jgi:hypothetical protein
VLDGVRVDGWGKGMRTMAQVPIVGRLDAPMKGSWVL